MRWGSGGEQGLPRLLTGQGGEAPEWEEVTEVCVEGVAVGGWGIQGGGGCEGGFGQKTRHAGHSDL